MSNYSNDETGDDRLLESLSIKNHKLNLIKLQVGKAGLPRSFPESPTKVYATQFSLDLYLLLLSLNVYRYINNFSFGHPHSFARPAVALGFDDYTSGN